ncbi:MAG: hypothetical protein WBQ89_24470 [Candidatus Acidiferrum sp.]
MRSIILLSFLCLANVVQAQTARDYFNELKAANAFNRYSDEYVCFRDDDIPSFVVIAKGNTIIEHMKKAGVTPTKEIVEAKDDIFLQSYHKGVANSEGELYSHVPKTESDYEIEFMKPLHGPSVYSINWLTGRYRYFLYALESKTLPMLESSGKCERIHADVF